MIFNRNWFEYQNISYLSTTHVLNVTLKHLIGLFLYDNLAWIFFASGIAVDLELKTYICIQPCGSKTCFRIKIWFRIKIQGSVCWLHKASLLIFNRLYYKLLKTKVQEANLTKEKFRKLVSELTVHELGIFHLSSISAREIFTMGKRPYIVCSLPFTLRPEIG